MLQAVVAGHICLDILPLMPDAPPERFLAALQPGHLLEIGPALFSTGGPVSNTGLALHTLGISTRLMGKVGADPFGRVIGDLLAAYAPELAGGLIVDPGSSTSYTVILNSPDVDRIFLHSPGANHTFCAADINFTHVAQADLFHFGYPPLMRRMYTPDGAELAEIFRRAKAAGVITSLDMAVPDLASPAGQANWRAIFQATLPYVDLFLPSFEELLMCLNRPQYEALTRQGDDILARVTPEQLRAASAELLEMGVKVVGLKLGARGLYVRTQPAARLRALGHALNWETWGDLELWAPCFQAQVVGTTGSGDATIAGFLSSLLRGQSLLEATTMAVAVGACNVEAADALSGLRSWEATWARVKAGWPRQALHLDSPGWQWLADAHLWRGPAA